MTESVELVDGRVYLSNDDWVTVYRMGKPRPITGHEADRIRYIAAVQHGGGRDELPTKGPRP